jgi:DNA-binding transcriptional LysR family regulator
MEEQDWLILNVLYSQKNITKAAKELFITQPTLTKRLQQIENEWGVQIVTRGMKGVTFTPQGEYLAQQAAEMLVIFDRIKDTVSQMHNEVAGTLKLGVTNLISMHILPPLLKTFKEKYPLVEYQLTTGLSREVYTLALNQDVHIGFIRGNYNWEDEKHLLYQEKICIVSKDKLELSELPRLPRIHFETDTTFKTLVENWWTDNYDQPPLISMEVDRGDTCREMVINGLGYAIMADRFVRDSPDVYKYELKDRNNKPILRQSWMYYYKESLEVNVVRAFVEHIKSSSLDA